MTTSFIYGLVDPRTGLVRYVGKTKNGYKRAFMHQLPSKLKGDKTYKANWIRELLGVGLTYEVRVLEEVVEEDLCTAEITWITFGLESGWPLTNLTRGGEGLSGHVFTEEHRAKISLANTGRKLTYEHRVAISQRMRGRPLTASQKKNLNNLGRRHSIETCARIGLAHRGKVLSAETRAKVSLAKGRPVLDLTTGVTYPSATRAAVELGLCYRSVIRVLRGGLRHTGGHRFTRLTTS